MPVHSGSFVPTTISIVAQSADSVLCLFEAGEDDEKELWVPKSVVDPDDWASNEDAWDECEELSIQKWWLDRNDIES